MNIFLKELQSNLKSLVIWCGVMFLAVSSGMTKYTALSADTSGSISEMLKTIPLSVRALLGFGSFDVSTMAGYFAILFIYVELAVAIHAALLGAGIIAREERRKTTEFLMVKPVARSTVLAAKLLAALGNLVVLNLVTLAISQTMVPLYNQGPDISSEIAVMYASMFFVQLVFMSLGAMLAAVLGRPKAAGSMAATILLGGYFLARVTDISASLAPLNLLSPLKYFNLVDMAGGAGLDPWGILGSLALIAAFVALSFRVYTRRDLRI